jgi:hypothetical protein
MISNFLRKFKFNLTQENIVAIIINKIVETNMFVIAGQ